MCACMPVCIPALQRVVFIALRSAALHDMVATCQYRKMKHTHNLRYIHAFPNHAVSLFKHENTTSLSPLIFTFCKARSRSEHDLSCTLRASRCNGRERNSSTMSNRLLCITMATNVVTIATTAHHSPIDSAGVHEWSTSKED